MTDQHIRLLVVDDQHLVRAGLVALLNMEDDLQVVAELPTGEKVVPTIREHRVDVVVMDIEMPEIGGLEATGLISSATEAKVLIVTTFGSTGYLQRALSAGASGFMVKDAPAEELAQAIRDVYSGKRVVDPALAVDALGQGNNPLTERERDVLRQALDGSSIKNIAQKLFLSSGTVRNHISSAIGKLAAGNRIEAAQIAERNGWL